MKIKPIKERIIALNSQNKNGLFITLLEHNDKERLEILSRLKNLHTYITSYPDFVKILNLISDNDQFTKYHCFLSRLEQKKHLINLLYNYIGKDEKRLESLLDSLSACSEDFDADEKRYILTQLNYVLLAYTINSPKLAVKVLNTYCSFEYEFYYEQLNIDLGKPFKNISELMNALDLLTTPGGRAKILRTEACYSFLNDQTNVSDFYSFFQKLSTTESIVSLKGMDKYIQSLFRNPIRLLNFLNNVPAQGCYFLAQKYITEKRLFLELTSLFYMASDKKQAIIQALGDLEEQKRLQSAPVVSVSEYFNYR